MSTRRVVAVLLAVLLVSTLADPVAVADPTGDAPPEPGLAISDGAIRLLTADAAPVRTLDGPPSHAPAAWSPDGTELALTVDDEDSTQIHLAAIDGGGSRRLTNVRGGCWSASWDPAGGRLACAGSQGVHVVSRDGRHVRHAALLPTPTVMGWSPTGERIAAASLGLLFVFRPDGGGWRRLADDLVVTDLAWRPDGRQLAIVARPWVWLLAPYPQVWLVDLDGGEPTPVPGTEFAYEVRWAGPDRLVVASLLGVGALAPDGTGHRRLSPEDSGLLFGLAVAPDGSRATYVESGVGVWMASMHDGSRSVVHRESSAEALPAAAWRTGRVEAVRSR